MNTRRLFLKILATSPLFVATAALPNCAQTEKQPVPFETGEAASPPLGCTELRAANNQGDC